MLWRHLRNERSIKGLKMSKYKQVYNEIKTQINNGNLAPLQELPSENELMQSYGFSKDTIRKALSLLEIDGYIQKQQGRNSIVLEHDLSKPQMLSEIKTVSELNSASTHQVKTTLTSLYLLIFNPFIDRSFRRCRHSIS